MSSRFEFTVSASQAGKRLDSAIAETEHGLSRSQAKNLIEAGKVTVDGEAAPKASLVLREGQLIRIEIPPPSKLDLTPRDVGLRLLHEDDDLAVLEKPAGISVHPSDTEKDPTVVHGLLHTLKSLSSVGGVERPGIVHRIDKGTSGVLVVSKTDQAHHELSRQFKAHTVERRYQALVYGDLSKKGKSGRIETFFGRHPTQRKKMTGKLKEGRKAITHWTVLETLPGPLTFVECRLETGRTHQIRVHLSELGYPLVGDPLYCDHERRAKALAKANRELAAACADVRHQLLHARVLGFLHPTTGKNLRFESELPADFSAVLAASRAKK